MMNVIICVANKHSSTNIAHYDVIHNLTLLFISLCSMDLYFYLVTRNTETSSAQQLALFGITAYQHMKADFGVPG
jgi:hypothetical protein